MAGAPLLGPEFPEQPIAVAAADSTLPCKKSRRFMSWPPHLAYPGRASLVTSWREQESNETGKSDHEAKDQELDADER